MSSKRPKALGFLIRLIVFSRGETPGANPAHPGILSRGFARRVSSYLTPNVLMFERDSMFQVTRRKGSLQKIEGLLPTGARDDNKKGAAICGVTS
jgi:hypothetical protein